MKRKNTNNPYIKEIQKLRLMDDEFLEKMLDENNEGVEYILKIILSNNKLKVLSAKSQSVYKGIQGRSIRLDIRAIDANNKIYDIEVQRDSAGAGAKRARFYSSMLDTKLLEANDDFNKFVETYVIFITEKDVLNHGRPIVHIDRVIKETGKMFNDEAHIIYVNGEYNDESSDIGRLMHDFRCSDPNKMYSSPLKEKALYLKNTEEGQKIMCKIIEDIADKREKDTLKRIVCSMYENGLTVDAIATYTELSIDYIELLLNESNE
ncbi:MAG: PD-(D/E)XK nuclease family transposase [Lachnospiraceae bacterium]|nr:PD-(D/E)XK nuclease family transposase [Lachnospiraceae bacterium]